MLGLGGLPPPGDAFQALTDAAKARQIALFRQTQAKEKALAGTGSRLTLESLQAQIAEGGMKELPIIIKADVQGSAEVLADTLTKLSDEKVKIRIIHSGVGAINESDVLLASASNAIIIGFNVRPDRNAADVAEREKVDIRLHSVIYNVIDEMKKAMTGLLDPTFKEVRIGAAEVRDTFKTPKFGTIAGCMVTEGRITRSGDTQARLLRDNVVVYEGKIGSLRRFKDDVSEVKAGFECGIGFEKYNDIKVGDVIEVFVVERVARRSSAVMTMPAECDSMAQSRPDRVGDQIRAELAELLAREVHDPGIGFLTHHPASRSRPTCSTRASTTRRSATTRRGRRPAKALGRATPFLRRQIGQRAAAQARARARVLLRRVDRAAGPHRADPPGDRSAEARRTPRPRRRSETGRSGDPDTMINDRHGRPSARTRRWPDPRRDPARGSGSC